MSRGGAVCIALTSDQREPPCILHLSFTVEGGGRELPGSRSTLVGVRHEHSRTERRRCTAHSLHPPTPPSHRTPRVSSAWELRCDSWWCPKTKQGRAVSRSTQLGRREGRVCTERLAWCNETATVRALYPHAGWAPLILPHPPPDDRRNPKDDPRPTMGCGCTVSVSGGSTAVSPPCHRASGGWEGGAG
jgi:hypothetical protein